MRELASQESDIRTVPRLAADEIGELAAAATALERRLRGDEARTVASAERERIARELHDGVAKSVSVLALEAATIAGKAPEPLRPDLARIERLARLLSEELRAIVTDVRSRDVDEPFAALLRRTVDRHPGVQIELEGELDRVGTLARFELVRVLEEALGNAARHAQASETVARVGVHDGHVRLEVEDNGRGVPEVRWDELARAGRYGLIGMRERAELLRGTIVVSSGPRGGTRVCVTVPVTPE
jgi:signal transduction histidine kinase